MLSSFFLFFSFFSYLTIFPFPTDVQPYALFIAIIITILNVNVRFTFQVKIIFFVMLYSIVVFLFSEFNINSFRSLLNYVSFFFIVNASYITLKNNGFRKIYYFALLTWLIVGVIQTYINSEFLSFLLPRNTYTILSDTSGRGVTSLAPEPTMYAHICICFWIIYMINFFESEKIYVNILVLTAIFYQIFFLSKSSTVIILLLVGFCIYIVYTLFYYRQFKVIFLAISLIFTILYSYYNYYLVDSDNRISFLLATVLEDPTIIFKLDQSVSDHFVHSFLPYYHLITSFGMPGRFDTFENYVETIYSIPSFDGITKTFIPLTHIRITSGFGSNIYELGVVGLLIPLSMFYSFKNLLKINKSLIYPFIVFMLGFIPSFHITVPIVGFIIGNAIYKNSLLS